jgi:2-iminobutanoate/2-iminopropanoate deaminase
MKRERIMPRDMTPPMGAYSHGYTVEVGPAKFIFVTGQIAIDHNGDLVSDDIVEQTRFVFDRVKAILEESGSSMRDVAKTQIFLTNISDFSVVSPIRNEFFAESQPASTLVEVSALVREGCKIEVEVIAISDVGGGL